MSVGQLRGDLSGWFQLVSVTNNAQTLELVTGASANGAVAAAGTQSWGALAIAFIVLACLIAAGALIAIIALCCFWSRLVLTGPLPAHNVQVQNIKGGCCRSANVWADAGVHPATES
jgi:hypothetical protein